MKIQAQAQCPTAMIIRTGMNSSRISTDIDNKNISPCIAGGNLFMSAMSFEQVLNINC